MAMILQVFYAYHKYNWKAQISRTVRPRCNTSIVGYVYMGDGIKKIKNVNFPFMVWDASIIGGDSIWLARENKNLKNIQIYLEAKKFEWSGVLGII